MKRVSLIAVVGVLLVFSTFVRHANATYTISEGIDGYVYGNEMPVEGIHVHVYNSADELEGYGVEPGPAPGLLGTDVTDASGYFHIAWLYGGDNIYEVVAETSFGDLVQYVNVPMGVTTRVVFNYYSPPPPVPEFPLGSAMPIAIIPLLFYIWWKKKQKTPRAQNYTSASSNKSLSSKSSNRPCISARNRKSSKPR